MRAAVTRQLGQAPAQIVFSASEKQTRTQMRRAWNGSSRGSEELPDDTAAYNHGITFDAGGAVILGHGR